MKLQNLYNDIADQIAVLRHRVKASAALGFVDVNLVSERLLLPIFRIIFDAPNLQDLNLAERKNFPAVDFGDDTKRIAIQVTSTNDLDKVKSTIETFVRHRLYSRFDRLIIYVLSDRQTSYSQKAADIATAGFFKFDVETDIIDYLGLLGCIKRLDVDDLQKVANLLSGSIDLIGPDQSDARIFQSVVSLPPLAMGDFDTCGFFVSESGHFITTGAVASRGLEYDIISANGVFKASTLGLSPMGIALARVINPGNEVFSALQISDSRAHAPDEPIALYAIDSYRHGQITRGVIQSYVFVGLGGYFQMRIARINGSAFGAPVLDANQSVKGVLSSLRKVSFDSSQQIDAISGEEVQKLINQYLS
jgi:hypothetical protein